MTDERLKKSVGEGRQDRAMQDRAVTQDREFTDAERLAMLNNSFSQALLPDLPQIPGYRTTWLTTTNPRDSIPMRQRLGYELIRAEEVPGFDHHTLKSAEWPGAIVVNEMIAARIPENLHALYLKNNHAVKPKEQESGITEITQAVSREIAKAGGRVERFDDEG